MITHFSIENKVLAAFGAAVLVVTGLAGTTWKVAQDAADAAQLVAHTHEVLDHLAHTRINTLQIEFSTQSYRISGDPARLAERDAAVAEREVLLGRVQQLTANNTRQQARWERLREVINERLAIASRVSYLRESQGLEAANAFAATAPLNDTRERSYRLMYEMDQEERQLLDQRMAEHLRLRQMLLVSGALVSVLLLLLLTATYILIRRQLRQTEASQRALADSEESLSITLHSIGDGVLATDNHGRITRMNPVAQVLTGWTMAAARGQPVEVVFDIVHEHTRAPAEVPVAKVLATGQIQELANHTVLIARDGSERPISDSAAPIRDAAGLMSGVVLVFRDVTVAHQAQQTIREQNEQLEQRVLERTAQLHDSEGHLRNVINNVPALIAYVDARQRYVYVNEQYLARFAPTKTDIAGCTVHEVLGDERYAIAAPLIDKVLRGEAQHYDWQPFPGVWQVINYLPRRDASDAVVGYYVLGTDITERKHTEEKIHSLNTELEQHVHELEHVSRALRTLSAGNRTMLRATDEQDLLESMCRAIVDVGRYPMAVVWYCTGDADHSMRPMAESGYADGLAGFGRLKSSWNDDDYGRGVVGTAIRTGQTSVVHNMLTDPNYAPWRAHLHGHACGVACPLRVGGEVIGALAIYGTEPDSIGADEVTLLTESADDLAFGIATLRARAEQQKVQAAMHHLTRYDALTGLPNEIHFTELLTAAIEISQRLGQSFVVLETNIERLSEINDSLGFSHGDQVLQEFAARLSAAAPESAVVARLRGDEFAILLPDSNQNDAIALVQHLESLLARPFPVADIALEVSAKIGVALFPQHGATPHDLFRHMDIAVHEAKKKGRRHVVFDPAQY